MKAVIASGYFDPIHVGHIEYFQKAKELGDKLIVIVNNSRQAKKKKGSEFMPFQERMEIVRAIKYVDRVVGSVDSDRTVCKSIEKVVKSFSTKPEKIIFAKGGDRTAGEIPEAKICRKLGVEIVDRLGEKIQSSSDLIKRSKK